MDSGYNSDMARNFSLFLFPFLLWLTACATTAPTPEPTLIAVITNTVETMNTVVPLMHTPIPTIAPTQTRVPTFAPTQTLTPTITPTASPKLPYVVQTTSITTPTNPALLRTYPFEFLPDYKNIDCYSPQTPDINNCAYAQAYDSARELDTLLLELDHQFPNGEWQLALGGGFFPQEEWGQLVVPYCEYAQHRYYAGTVYTAFFLSCVTQENRNRAEYVTLFACRMLDNFTWDCDED